MNMIVQDFPGCAEGGDAEACLQSQARVVFFDRFALGLCIGAA